MRRFGMRLVRLITCYMVLGWVGLFKRRSNQNEPLVIVQGVILSEEGVALGVRPDLWGWELPGGNLEPGEREEDGLVREIREEVGLEVEVEAFVGEYNKTGFLPYRARVYRCRVVSGELAVSDETLAVGWFDPEQPPDTLFPWFREPLADALERKAPVQRSERQGPRAILTAAWIDIKMRFGGAFDPVWEKQRIPNMFREWVGLEPREPEVPRKEKSRPS